MNGMKNNMENLINDLKTAIEIEHKIVNLKTLKMESPVEKLIETAIDYRTIKTTSDLFNVVKQFPEFEERIISIYDKILEKKQKERDEYYKKEIIRTSKYSGTYDNYSDAPGYGTEWNERCIPDGVYIRNAYGRRDC